MDGQKESIKYCARKCHNGGPLTKMMANHTKKFSSRTIDSSQKTTTKWPLLNLLAGAQIMSPTILKLLLTAMTMVSSVTAAEEGGLQCYIDVEAKTIVTCNELEGFKTCFIKYNDSKYIPSAFPFGVLHQYQEAAVVGRGCSTKDKVFYKECETHNYGDSLEKMCFCSFQLCNTSNQLNCPSIWTLTLLVFLASFYHWIWDPWPIKVAGSLANLQPQTSKSDKSDSSSLPQPHRLVDHYHQYLHHSM